MGEVISINARIERKMEQLFGSMPPHYLLRLVRHLELEDIPSRLRGLPAPKVIEGETE